MDNATNYQNNKFGESVVKTECIDVEAECFIKTECPKLEDMIYPDTTYCTDNLVYKTKEFDDDVKCEPPSEECSKQDHLHPDDMEDPPDPDRIRTTELDNNAPDGIRTTGLDNNVPTNYMCIQYYPYYIYKVELNNSSVDVTEGTHQAKDSLSETEPPPALHQSEAPDQTQNPCASSESSDNSQEAGTKNKKFTCEVCSYSALRRAHLIRHMKVHTDEKPYSCTVCNYSAKHKENLSVHMRRHTGEKPYKCRICHYCTRDYNTLTRHVSKTHKNELLYSCDECKFTTSVKCELSKHVKLLHTSEKPYKCEICDYSTGNKCNLTRHIKVHTREEPFNCSMCACAFLQKSQLTSHMRIHTEDKYVVYNCTVCNISTASKGLMTVHMRHCHDRHQTSDTSP